MSADPSTSQDQRQQVYSALRERVLNLLSRKAQTADGLVPVPKELMPADAPQLYAAVFSTAEYLDFQRRLSEANSARLFSPFAMALACVIGVRNEEGIPVFLLEDVATLVGPDSAGFRVYDLARVVYLANSFIDDPGLRQTIAKNSDPTENSTSPSDLPTITG